MTDNKNRVVVDKLKNDLAYYKTLLQEIEKQSVSIRNEYEYLKNIYPNLINNSQYIDYYIQHTPT